MPRFNVGDRVTITRNTPSGVWGTWARHMDVAIGQTATVTAICGRRGQLYDPGLPEVNYKLDGLTSGDLRFCYWPEEVLQPAFPGRAAPHERFCVGIKRAGSHRVDMLVSTYDNYDDARRRVMAPHAQEGLTYYIIPLRAVAESTDGRFEEYE